MAEVAPGASVARQGLGRSWLFSPAIDVSVFLVTALLSLALVALGEGLAGSGGEVPEWTWLTGVLLVDVAHVWATAFVVYFDPRELRRRSWLYLGVPLGAYAAGVALFQLGESVFWRVVAYLAILHFVRQQWGFVALYRRRAGERGRVGAFIDGAMIHAAALYPVVVWHTQLPRAFAWMTDGDLLGGLPASAATIALALYVGIIAAYLISSLVALRQGVVNPMKHAVIVTTAACWYVGIVATNSDFAFTVTNVFIHGVPYLALVYFYLRGVQRDAPRGRGFVALVARGGVAPFLLTLWALAYFEELLWDRNVWHDRAWLFGDGDDAGSGSWQAWLVPLLAVPQLTHYVLDGVIWRRSANPRLEHLWR